MAELAFHSVRLSPPQALDPLPPSELDMFCWILLPSCGEGDARGSLGQGRWPARSGDVY